MNTGISGDNERWDSAPVIAMDALCLLTVAAVALWRLTEEDPRGTTDAGKAGAGRNGKRE